MTFQYQAIHSQGTRNSRTCKILLKTTVLIKFILVGLFWHLSFITCGQFVCYIEIYFTFARVDCVRYNADFVKSRFCSIRFNVILAGLKKIVCYTKDFVIQSSLNRGSTNNRCLQHPRLEVILLVFLLSLRLQKMKGSNLKCCCNGNSTL